MSIQFKEFGVRLRFTPEIMPNGNIHLKVVPEVSNLDFTNGADDLRLQHPGVEHAAGGNRVRVAGRAELRHRRIDGQPGHQPGQQGPWLGDIPILGNFFKSKNAQKSKTELMVLCTVKKFLRARKPAALPNDPVPFMDKDKFDGKKPETANNSQVGAR